VLTFYSLNKKESNYLARLHFSITTISIFVGLLLTSIKMIKLSSQVFHAGGTRTRLSLEKIYWFIWRTSYVEWSREKARLGRVRQQTAMLL
jgi:hypothetical protein